MTLGLGAQQVPLLVCSEGPDMTVISVYDLSTQENWLTPADGKELSWARTPKANESFKYFKDRRQLFPPFIPERVPTGSMGLS